MNDPEYDEVLFDDVMRAFYGDAFYNVGWWEDARATPSAASRALVRRTIAPIVREPRAVLEAGCGIGGSTRELRERWPQASLDAIGVSRRQLDACRSLVPAARFHAMDAARMEFSPASFDAVVSIEAALHFDTRAAFFKRARRVLRAGGVLAIADLVHRSDAWPGASTVPRANLCESLDAYTEHLRAAGFTTIHVEDVTALTWVPYLARVDAFLNARAAHDERARNWLQKWHYVRSAPMPWYVIVTAQSP